MSMTEPTREGSGRSADIERRAHKHTWHAAVFQSHSWTESDNQEGKETLTHFCFPQWLRNWYLGHLSARGS